MQILFTYEIKTNNLIHEYLNILKILSWIDDSTLLFDKNFKNYVIIILE